LSNPDCYRVYVRGVEPGHVDVFVRCRNLEEAAAYKAHAAVVWPANEGVEVWREIRIPLTPEEESKLADLG